MGGVRDASDEPTGSAPLLSADYLIRAWRSVPPTLRGHNVWLREVEASDAPTLLALLSRDEIARVIAPPPRSVGELASRIEAARLDRAEGRGICFACVPDKVASPVGLFRLRELEPGFGTAEWEFVLAPEQWGRGMFFAAAPLVIDFAFDVLQVHRLEARAAVHNARGVGALRKIGAVQEGVLRQSLPQHEGWVDQALWTILADDWRARTGRRGVH